MKKIETVAEMQRECAALRAAGRTIALVVTGGSIHEGHLALIRAAREKAEGVVVSLFPNPLQFGASEGFAHYPRTTEADGHGRQHHNLAGNFPAHIGQIAFLNKMDFTFQSFWRSI